MGNRRCGDCQLCCKLMPVVELAKGAGTRCQHQAHHVGCRVYGKATMPASCSLWNCGWLVEDDTGDLRRPDRSHYVIDVIPDFVTLKPNDGGPEINTPVVQVWCDPAFPDSHRDPALRALLDRRRVSALVRYDSQRAYLVAPPSVASDGKWHEVTSGTVGHQHSAAEVASVLRGEG